MTDWQENTANWTTPWTNEGGDYDSTTALDTYQYNGSENRLWHTFDVTSAVKDFVAEPESNYGFMVCAEFPNHRTENHYRSSEANEQSERPKLTITYESGTNIESPAAFNSAPLYTIRSIGSMLSATLTAGETGTFSLYGINGSCVKHIKINGENSICYNTAGISAGTYLVTIKSTKGYYAKKLVIY
jgi:hypothetical protein